MVGGDGFLTVRGINSCWWDICRMDKICDSWISGEGKFLSATLGTRFLLRVGPKMEWGLVGGGPRINVS